MEMVTIAQAAEALKCSRANVYQMIKRRGLNTRRMKVTKKYEVKRDTYEIHVDLDLLRKE
jgi:excisionase family DNA binding protein